MLIGWALGFGLSTLAFRLSTMTTLEGIARQAGIAIAVAAVVDATNGINGVSHALLQNGINALRQGLHSQDYPQAIIACDSLAVGAVMRIPGINTIAIAAEGQTDVAGLAIEVPCVLGVADLLKSIDEGDILIVDGNRGVVHIDPEPRMLTHYQQAEEQRHAREKIFITSEHIPARTQTGETVYVYARIVGDGRLSEALDNGADGLLVDLRGSGQDMYALGSRILREAAGKPVVFLVDVACEEILRATMLYCTPWQVTLVSENVELLASQVEAALNGLAAEALQMDVETPQVNIGLRDPAVLIDAPEEIEHPVSKGARMIAVKPEAIAPAKYSIRSISLEDEG